MGGKGSGPKPGGGNKSTRALQRAQCPKAPDAETNAAILEFNKEIFLLPEMEDYEPAHVAERIAEYIQIAEKHGMKLQVNGGSLALGMSREDLYNLTHDKQCTFHGMPIPAESVALMRKFYLLLASAMESAINDGKGNPVGQIFLAKNHFGYVSEVVHVTEQAKRPEQLQNADDVAAKYRLAAGSQTSLKLPS